MGLWVPGTLKALDRQDLLGVLTTESILQTETPRGSGAEDLPPGRRGPEASRLALATRGTQCTELQGWERALVTIQAEGNLAGAPGAAAGLGVPG